MKPHIHPSAEGLFHRGPFGVQSSSIKRPDVETGGGPPYGGGMEARVAKLESDVQHIREGVADLKIEARGHRDGLTKIVGDINAEFRSVNGEFTKVREEMSRDFRLLFGALIVGILGLAGIMAKGFNWIG